MRNIYHSFYIVLVIGLLSPAPLITLNNSTNKSAIAVVSKSKKWTTEIKDYKHTGKWTFSWKRTTEPQMIKHKGKGCYSSENGLSVLLIFYSRITTYQIQQFKKHKCILSQFLCVNNLAQHSWSAYGLTRLKSMCQPELLSHLRVGSSSKLIRVIGKVQFLEVIELMSLFSCWLFTGGHSQLLKPASYYSESLNSSSDLSTQI